MKHIQQAILCVLAVHLATVATASDWPTFMYDNTRVGRTPDNLESPLVRQWVYEAPSAPQRAWPGPGRKVIEGLELRHRVSFDDVFHVAVVGDRVYFGSSVDNRVHCVDAKTGAEQWGFFTGGPVRLAPTIWNHRVYVGSDDGHVYCLDATNGTVVWQLRAGPRDDRILARGRMTSRWPVRTGVLVDGGVAYFGAGIFPHATVYLYAVDAETGEVIWKNDDISQRDAGRNDLTPQGYLLATKDTLFVPSGRALPNAFSRMTGQLIHREKHGWRRDAGGQIGGTQAFLADNQIYSVGEHHVLAMNQQKGSVGFGWFQGRQMTLGGDMAYLANGEEIVALDRLRHAAATRERHELQATAKTMQGELRSHAAHKDLQAVVDAKAQLERAQSRLDELAAASKKGTEEYSTARTAHAKQQEAVAAAEKKYEQSRIDYLAKKTEHDSAQEQIDVLSRQGVKWSVASPHESTMVLAGDTLVVGGVNEAALFEVDSGEKVWSAGVDGETRGLAVADGQLYVSTTKGKIYCFASDAQRPGPSERATQTATPYPKDDLSETYSAAANSIVQLTGITSGFCLVIGSEQGRLAYELAKRTDLKIYCLESDQKKVAASRRALSATGLYGIRISVDHLDGSVVPYSNYFANLVVSDTLLLTGNMPGVPVEIARHLKPVGGVMCLGPLDRASEDPDAPDRVTSRVSRWLAATKLAQEDAVIEQREGWMTLTRGRLPGAGSWSHQYANAGNTASSDDTRLHGGLRVLWYGDPGVSKMLNRHSGAVGPVSANGRLFVQGDRDVMAYDAYNGEFLWQRTNPGAHRTGVWNNHEPGNLAASDDSLFVVVEDKCLQLNAASGAIERTHIVPGGGADDGFEWGFVAYKDGHLYGTRTKRKLILEEARRRGRVAEYAATDSIFCIGTGMGSEPGQLLWTYDGKSVAHNAIAMGDGKVFFVESSITPQQREDLLRQDKSELKNLRGEEQRIAEERMKKLDARLVVALDAQTGAKLWAKPVDVTDCTGVGIGAGQLTLVYHMKQIVLCGANANGHYWKQFLAGEFKRRRLVVLSGETGEKIWAKDANYRHRPILVGSNIVAEPWAFDLWTGAQRTRTHPLTGQPTPWKFGRPGHHCGAISATKDMMFFRSGFTAYYDLNSDAGTQHFAGHRHGCWINAIPANGLLMIPEASAGCVCLFSLASTIVLEPHENRDVWAVYSAEGANTPVQHLALNLGAPGDRRDTEGKLWLGYPRPSSRQALELSFDLGQEFADGGKFVSHNTESFRVANTDAPWVFASGARGLRRCALPLIADGQEPATYTVRLFFADFGGEDLYGREFSVKLQDKTLLEHVDVAREAGGSMRALAREFHEVQVTDNLFVEIIQTQKNPSESQLPVLCGIEVLRSGTTEITQ